MIEVLKQNLTAIMSQEEKTNRTREYLQVLLLKMLFDKGVFRQVAFVGGTALRLLHGLRRFSEDIDFSLINKKDYDFQKMMQYLEEEFKKNNLATEITVDSQSNVHSGFVKFPGLLAQLGLSSHKDQKISIKVEVDTNPPAGWETALVPVTAHFVFAVTTFDLPSLFATKLHACFFRRFIKGRDFYDLVWYLGKRIEPNFVVLNNAIQQTEKDDLNISQDNFRAFLHDRLGRINFDLVKKDVERFLEDKNELKLLDKEMIMNMV